MYKHLTTKERNILSVLFKKGYSIAYIASIIGVHRSTLYRELKRNSKHHRYREEYAVRVSQQRRKDSKKAYRLIENNPEIEYTLRTMIHPLVSPECIAHIIGIHYTTIYRWIDRTKEKELIHKLPQKQKRRQYGMRKHRGASWLKNDAKSIHTRKEYKHIQSWEGDTIVGVRNSTKRILTHVERKSLFLRAHITNDGSCDSIYETLKHNPLKGIITYDRGSEFALWRMIEKALDVCIYFTDPNSPGQRGKNENTNGRLRRIFPKKTSFDTIQQIQLDSIVSFMNNTPRKTLQWKTPIQVYTDLYGEP